MKFLQNRKFVVNLHHNKTETHGVAVTLLILVQSSGVRIPVGLQFKTSNQFYNWLLFYFTLFYKKLRFDGDQAKSSSE